MYRLTINGAHREIAEDSSLLDYFRDSSTAGAFFVLFCFVLFGLVCPPRPSGRGFFVFLFFRPFYPFFGILG